MIDFVIIGGGIAGLSAAIRLTELGKKPLVIEAGKYPTDKVCGEFFSPECIDILRWWKIELLDIPYIQFQTNNNSFKFQFPKPGGSFSHLSFGPLLAKKAEKGGAIIKTNVSFKNFDPKTRLLTLTNGEMLYAKNLIVASGQIPTHASPKDPVSYVGIKSHFDGFPFSNTLEIFSFDKAYMGIMPIEKNKFNATCLVTIERFQKAQSIENLIKEFETENPHFSSFFSHGRKLFPQWMVSHLPDFGIKQIPNWEMTYFIGDAFATVPPISGHGLSLAILGGIFAAEFSVKNDPEGFKAFWQDYNQSHMEWSKVLHQISMRPWLSNKLLYLSKFIPSIPKFLYRLTRSKSKLKSSSNA